MSKNLGVLKMKDLKQKIINNPIEEISSILWGSNKKIGDIPSLIGESPLDCSSKKRGFCDICKECYAISDYKQYESHRERVNKSILFFELIKEDKTIYNLFERVLNYFDVVAIRYNLEGDFKDKSDILFLKEFAKANPQIKVYGYSKRRDLKEEIEKALKLNNFYCGVNFKCKGANQFITTSYIFDYMKSPLKCLGDCNKCQKCFNLKNKNIYCFIHGSPSKIQSKLNTPQNWEDMAIIIEQYLGFDLIPKSGLFCKAINESLEDKGFKVPYSLTKKGNKTYKLNTVPKLLKYIQFIGGF